jgi:hypothetical protein
LSLAVVVAMVGTILLAVVEEVVLGGYYKDQHL